MKAAVKEYNIQVDYCACMVAILLARHQVDSSNANVVWSAVNISEKLNLQPFSETANFYVDSDALQHGMSIFQRILNKRVMLIVPEGLEIQPMNDSCDLKAARRVVKIKFVGYSSTHKMRQYLNYWIKLGLSEMNCFARATIQSRCTRHLPLCSAIFTCL